MYVLRLGQWLEEPSNEALEMAITEAARQRNRCQGIPPRGSSGASDEVTLQSVGAVHHRCEAGAWFEEESGVLKTQTMTALAKNLILI